MIMDGPRPRTHPTNRKRSEDILDTSVASSVLEGRGRRGVFERVCRLLAIAIVAHTRLSKRIEIAKGNFCRSLPLLLSRELGR